MTNRQPTSTNRTKTSNIRSNVPVDWHENSNSYTPALDETTLLEFRTSRTVVSHQTQSHFLNNIHRYSRVSNLHPDSIKTYSNTNQTTNMAMLFPWTHYFANHRHPSSYHRFLTDNPELADNDEGLLWPYGGAYANISSDLGSGESADNDTPIRIMPAQNIDWTGWELNFIMHGIVMPIIAVLGMLANFASLFILTRRAMRSAVVNTYLAALSAFDGLLLLIALLLYPPMSYCEYSVGSNPTSFWCEYFFHSALFLYPLSLIMQTGSVWILTALTVDRFIAITWPLANRKWCTNKRALCVTVCILIWSILYNIPAFMELRLVDQRIPNDADENRLAFITLLDRTELRKNNTYVSVYKGYCYLIFMLLLPAGTMIVLNAYVAVNVRRASDVRRRSMNVSNNPGRDDRERRCTVMAVLVVGTFLILNSLAFVNNMLEGFWNERELAKTNFLTLVCIGNVLVALNSAINFFIYYALGLRFRQMFCKYFCRLCYTPEREYQYLSVYYGSGRNYCWTNGGAAREMTTMGGDSASNALMGGGIMSMRTVSVGKGPHKVPTRTGASRNISAPAMQQSSTVGRWIPNQRNFNPPQSGGVRISPPVDAAGIRTYQNRLDIHTRNRSPAAEH